jgi:hypothetical protein
VKQSFELEEKSVVRFYDFLNSISNDTTQINFSTQDILEKIGSLQTNMNNLDKELAFFKLNDYKR